MGVSVAYVGAPLEDEIRGVVQIPVLKIVYLDLTGLKKIDGACVFTSKRGIVSLKMSNVSIKSNRIYCIGEQTAAHLQTLYSLTCQVPKVQNSDCLAEMLISKEKSIRIISSDQISEKFLKKLRANDISVRHTVAYRIEENVDADYHLLEGAKRILIGSSRSFEILNKNAKGTLKGKKLYAIGKPTEETMISLGFSPTECFESPDIESVLALLITKR